MHRVGGLEKQDVTGTVSYDPDNHQHMTHLRAKKVADIANDIPLQQVDGPDRGDLLVVSWGGTFGANTTAVKKAQKMGLSVAHAHLRYLNPFPRNLGEILDRYKKVLVTELNLGQLRTLIRARYLKDAGGYNKIKGKPFTVAELVAKIQETITS